MYEYSIIGGRMERKVREVMGRDTLLAIPAHVTAYGRTKLWELIEAAGWEHVYYMDTDSLIVSRLALGRLGKYFHRDSLGGLRLVRASPHLFIRAPKWYILGDVRKRGGVKADAREIKWNTFEQEETRSTRWALSHESPCTAIVELVTTSGPLKDRLDTRAMGSRAETLRIGPEPTRPAPGVLAPRLPLQPFPPEVRYDRK